MLHSSQQIIVPVSSPKPQRLHGRLSGKCAPRADGAALRSYTEHSGAVNAVDFHPSGAVAVSASEDCTMRFYEWRHAMPRRTSPACLPA